MGASPSRGQQTDTNGEKTRVKVIMLGEMEVGKTCLSQRALQPDLLQIDSYRSTMAGPRGPTLTRDWPLEGGDVPENLRGITLQIWDTAGQHQCQYQGSSFCRGADGVVFVYDVARRESFETLECHLELFFAHSHLASLKTDEQRFAFPKLVVGNKADAPAASREVSQADGFELAERIGAVFCETSARTGEFCSEAIENIASMSARRSVVHEFVGPSGSLVKSVAKT
jgi:small GTP-binding protein